MKKKISILIICLVVGSLLSIGSLAEGKFHKTKQYKENFFDLADNAWYKSEVISAYELGLMNGTEENTFSPDMPVTVAQAVTLACRLRSIYLADGETFDAIGVPWYEPYFNYAVKNNILKESQFDSANRTIKRYEFIQLAANALPIDCFGKINEVNEIIDVDQTKEFYNALLLFYRAGIVMGNDEFGTFLPENSIKRSELSAILNRIAIPENRLKKNLTDRNADAIYLIDDLGMTGRNGLGSGWTYDNRNQFYNLSGRDSNVLADSYSTGYVAINRKFDPQTKGILQFETYIQVGRGNSGLHISFSDDKGNVVADLFTKESKFHLSGKTEIDTGLSAATFGDYIVKMTLDLEHKTVSALVNGVNAGSVSLGEGSNIAKVTFSTTKNDILTVTVNCVSLYRNYAVNERFTEFTPKDALSEWDATGFSVKKIDSNRGFDVFSAYTNLKANETSVAQKQFAPVSGKVCFESYLLLPTGNDGASVTLKSGGKEIVTVKTKQSLFVDGRGDALRSFTPNIWQCIRIEADTRSQSALIRIDGKTIGTYAFENSADSFDAVSIGFAPDKAGEMWFDDVTVAEMKEHADYVSVPTPAESKNYNIGLHTCNLWHGSSSGEGWDAVSPFKEQTPYLGFYDEGLPEVADWETKWMVEHGIDFEHLCWYCPNADQTAPIKRSRQNYDLHDGYFNSKYSDMLKFCIMWENGTQNVTSLEQFKTYLWPYWMEYYFTDSRYETLDNKPVLTVWSYAKYILAFGGTGGAKEATDFMDAECKKLGFDGIILLFADGAQMTKEPFEQMALAGASGKYGYHWGRDGYDPEYQIYRLTSQLNIGVLHTIPTISSGFNDIGRNEIRSPVITPENHLKVLDYVKNTFLPNYKTGSWKDNTLFISTWNEFSEGTYVMPSDVHGFGYLDNVRAVYTEAASHVDEMPTANQLSRIANLYPKDHNPIRWLKNEKPKVVIPTNVKLGWDFSKKEDAALWVNQFGIKPGTFDNTNGVISGEGLGIDFAITLKNTLNLDIDETPYLHVRMKNSVKTKFELYFITQSDSEWNGKKYFSTNIEKTGEFVDYYVKLSDNQYWKGSLKSLRLDPQTEAGTFAIEKIELLTTVGMASDYRVLCNRNLFTFNFPPEPAPDGDYYVTADPRLGFFSMMGLYQEYSRFSGRLSLASATVDLVLQEGSNIVTVNGVAKDLGYVFTLRDGLPVFAIKKLCTLLGYRMVEGVNELRIYPAGISEEQIAILESRKNFEWEFKIDGDSEGFYRQNCALSVENDNLIGKAEANANGKYDPAVLIAGLKVDTDLYSKIVIRIKNDVVAVGGDVIKVYFRNSDNAFDEAKSVNLPLVGQIAGAYREYTLDLSANVLWDGTITSIRIDPFNVAGEFDIDYIRLVK